MSTSCSEAGPLLLRARQFAARPRCLEAVGAMESSSSKATVPSQRSHGIFWIVYSKDAPLPSPRQPGRTRGPALSFQKSAAASRSSKLHCHMASSRPDLTCHSECRGRLGASGEAGRAFSMTAMVRAGAKLLLASIRVTAFLYNPPGLRIG